MASAAGANAASVSIERRIVREATERFARETRDNALWSLFIEHVRRAEAAAAGAGAGATSSELSILDVYLEFDASVRAALDALGANYVRIVSRAVDDEPDLPDAAASTRKSVLGDIVAQASAVPVAPIGADVPGSGGHPVGASLLDKVLAGYGDGGSGGNGSAEEQRLYAELRAEQQSKLAEVVAIASGAKAVHENAAQQLDPVVTAYENVVDAAKFAVALDDYLDDTRTAAELVVKETARASAALGDARAALIEKLGIAVPAARDARKLSYIKQLEASVADVQRRAIDSLADDVAQHDSERELRKRLGAASARMWQFDERRVRELATDAAATLARFIDRVGDGDVASAKAALAAAATVGTAVANAFLAASRLAAGPGVDTDAAAAAALPNTGLLTRVAGLAAGAERALGIVAGERRRVGVFNVETAQHEAGALVVRSDDGTDRAHIYVVVPLDGAAAVRDIGVWLWQRDAYVHVGAPDTLQPLAVPAGTAALVFDAKQSELLRGRRFALVGADWVLAFGAMAWPTGDTAAAAPKRPGFDVRVVKTQAPRRLRISSAGGEGSIVEGAAIEFGDVTDEVYWARLAPNIGGERTVEPFDADGADAFAFPGLLAAGTDEALFAPGADLAAAAVGDRFQLVRAQPSAATTATAPVGTTLGLRSVPVLVEVLSSAVDV